METMKIGEWKVADVEYCTDCGAHGPTYRQPWRGVVLCETCWVIDISNNEEENP